jgi:hypothetical protein
MNFSERFEIFWQSLNTKTRDMLLTGAEKDFWYDFVEQFFKAGFKKGQESKIIPSQIPSDKAALVTDEMVNQARKETLEEVKSELLKWTQLHPAQLGQITKGLEALKNDVGKAGDDKK